MSEQSLYAPCREAAVGLRGVRLTCVRNRGHLGTHWDRGTGEQWQSVGPVPTWRNYWRRQTGAVGFAVEWVCWGSFLTAILKLIGWVLGRIA